MNTKSFIALATLSLAGTAAMAGELIIVKDTFTPTKSRAEVKAEVLKARAAGVLQFVTELQSHVDSVAPATAATASALTREQVRAQLLKSPRPQAGELYPAA